MIDRFMSANCALQELATGDVYSTRACVGDVVILVILMGAVTVIWLHTAPELIAKRNVAFGKVNSALPKESRRRANLLYVLIG